MVRLHDSLLIASKVKLKHESEIALKEIRSRGETKKKEFDIFADGFFAAACQGWDVSVDVNVQVLSGECLEKTKDKRICITWCYTVNFDLYTDIEEGKKVDSPSNEILMDMMKKCIESFVYRYPEERLDLLSHG